MGSYQNRCMRILKQYGNHIKKFDERLNNPLDDSAMKKVIEKCGVNKPVHYQRKIELSWFAKRTQNITCYEDLEVIANGS